MWPCTLSDTFKRALLDKATIANSFKDMGYSNASAIQRAKGMVYLTSGAASIQVNSSANQSTFIGLLASESWLGAAGFQQGLFDDSLFEFEPIFDVSCILFKFSEIEKLSQNNHECYKWLFHCARKMSRDILQFSLLYRYDVNIRIVYFLFFLLLKTQKHLIGSLPMLPISQTTLAQATGVGRPRVSQAIKRLCEEGILDFESSKIIVTDLRALATKLEGIDLTLYNPVSETLARYNKA